MKIYQQNWVPKIVYPNPTRSFVPQKDLFRTCSKEKRPESAASKLPICSLSRYAFISPGISFPKTFALPPFFPQDVKVLTWEWLGAGAM